MRHDLEVPRRAGHPGGVDPGRSPSQVSEVQQYLDIVRRRWWVIATAALVALAAAWWGERDKIPGYTAEVLLEHRRDSPLVGFPGAAASADFASQVEVLRSRAVMAAVVDSLGLQLSVENREGERSRIIGQVEADPDTRSGPYVLEGSREPMVLLRGPQGDTVARGPADDWISGPGFRLRLRDPAALGHEPLRFRFRDRQVAVERLQRQIRIEPGRNAAMIRVHYTDPDPNMAAAVVNTLASSYQAQRAQGAREQARRRREVIASQLVGLADSLEAAQSEVVAYQRQAQFIDPSHEGGHVMSAVLDIENELRTLRFQEGLLSSAVASLRSDEGGDESLHQILSLGSELVPAGPGLHQRLQELQVERARLTASSFGRLEGDPGVQVVDSLLASTRGQMRRAVEQGLDHLRARIQGAEARLAEMRRNMSAIPGQTAELGRLRQRANAVQDVVDVLVDRYYEAQIAEAVEAGDVAVLDEAPVPLWPDTSRTGLILLVSLVGGVLIGAFAAMAMEYLDLRVRRVVDAEEVTGLPLVAMVPRMGGPKRDPVTAAIAREAFRALRTNLHFAHGTAPRVLSLTSATPKEGKTTVAINLAASLAEKQGPGTVLLIDADLRRPQIHHVFGIDPKPGLTELLREAVAIEDAIRPSPLHSKLHILSCGGRVSNPSELISSEAFPELIDQLRQRFGYIVIDTPPLLAVTDGAVIAKSVDGTLMVVRANHADRPAVTHAMDHLRQIHATMLGVILNAVGTGAGDGRYAYGYHEEYVEEAAEETHRTRRNRDRRQILLGSTRGTD